MGSPNIQLSKEPKLRSMTIPLFGGTCVNKRNDITFPLPALTMVPMNVTHGYSCISCSLSDPFFISFVVFKLGIHSPVKLDSSTSKFLAWKKTQTTVQLNIFLWVFAKEAGNCVIFCVFVSQPSIYTVYPLLTTNSINTCNCNRLTVFMSNYLSSFTLGNLTFLDFTLGDHGHK